jgi:mono/diheme cytochrome c family protein
VSPHPSGKYPHRWGWNPFGLLFGSAFVVLLLIQTVRADPGGDAKLGKTIYLKRCASCHGQKGDGLGFRSNLPNFTDAKAMAAKTDQELFDKISNGGKGTGMPAWKKILSEQDRWHVLAYIRTFKKP